MKSKLCQGFTNNFLKAEKFLKKTGKVIIYICAAFNFSLHQAIEDSGLYFLNLFWRNAKLLI